MAFGSGKRTRSEIDPEIAMHSDSDNEAAHGDVRADADEGECESDCYQLEEDGEVEGKNDEVNPLYGEVNPLYGAQKGKILFMIEATPECGITSLVLNLVTRHKFRAVLC
jgi:hypothetical protein